MSGKRPYLASTLANLQELFDVSGRNQEVLESLLVELAYRSTSKAKGLRARVELQLEILERERKTGASDDREEYPTYHVVHCRGCQSVIRLPIRPERIIYGCPTCKAEFETVFKGRVLQVIWVENLAKEGARDRMTDELARELLLVGKDADFSAIKEAWRKACQQYHPDKHQGLPERLRSAAEAEMKRINAAYRYLENLNIRGI